MIERNADSLIMDTISGLEQLVLLSTHRLHPDAYGVPIKDQLLEMADRDHSMGAIYAALDRLETRGLVKSRQGPPEAKRGGRAKLFYELTATGLHALRASLQASDRLRSGLDLEGLPA